MGILNIFQKKKSIEDTEDFEKDLHSVMEFLAHVGKDIKDVYEMGVKVKKKREKERVEVNDQKQLKLLEDEIKAWDQFLERFVMLQRDTIITGERAKKISAVLKEEAEKMQIDPDLKKMVKSKSEWTFNW